jgi:hypothetical protein
MDASGVRDHLVRALEVDLVGPFAQGEVLPLPPSRWYFTGFLAPRMGRDREDPPDDDFGAGSDEDDDDSGKEELAAKRRSRFSASMGMSVLLPPGPETDAVRVTLSWAEYAREGRDEEEGRKKKKAAWRRKAAPPVVVDLALSAREIDGGVRLPQGILLCGKLGVVDLPVKGARALALFVVNDRNPGDKGKEDEQFLFQVRMEIAFARGILPRPNPRDQDSSDWDARVADLQFRGSCEWGVGHGVSVEAVPEGGKVGSVATTWVPKAEVFRVGPRLEPGVVVSMETLAKLEGGDAVRSALGGIALGYGKWIAAQRAIDVDGKDRRETREHLMRNADETRRRMAEGIDLLATNAEALEAFRTANDAMAKAARQRRKDVEPEWRLFQLAFVLLNLPALVDPKRPDRDTVELIYFPTGGGKTEAYLGVIAFALVLRRLRGRARPDRGLGVAVLLRYTLRLLTLDQLGRAATLVCALEKIRRARPEILGDVRFSVGLWVGRSATANTLEEVRDKVTEYKTNTARPSPFPLTGCPWCGKDLSADSLTVQKTGVVVGCNDRTCDFTAAGGDGLPVLFVDEQIYRELPCFVVATVDKFAMLPWRGETGMLFGRVTARDGRAFHGPMDDAPKGSEPLPEGLRPPELVVQDELHLISGPLGTMVGLYETAIDALATHEGVRPKVIASTATVQRARAQVQALFGRDETRLFPPPGVDDSDTWFAAFDRTLPSRLYVGVAASGKALKAILLRAYVTLLAGANRLWDPADPVADPYMTVVGYFNSLRELGGMRRLIEDEVHTRARKAEDFRPSDSDGPHPWLRNRAIQSEPIELTSRESTGSIARSKSRLGKQHSDPDHADVALASNMISVGVDIDRLGLMVVAGQPKTTSEYIQASSRVGRRFAGLVVTCFNVHKPRDRSHFERFVAYHESFYRGVEATSVTPFSGRALERGLAGVLVSMARLGDGALTPPDGAMKIAERRAGTEKAVVALAERRARQSRAKKADVDAIVDRTQNLLDAWEEIVREAKKSAGEIAYSRWDKVQTASKKLLRTVLDDTEGTRGTPEAKFVVPTSMRDVEPTTHLWVKRKRLGE